MKLTDFDRIQMLCLDRRKNGWRSIEKQFADRGAKVERFIVGKGQDEVLKYDQVDGKDIGQWGNYTNNAYWCYQAHRKMLQEAIDDKVESLLMLEDDVFLTDNFDEILDMVSREIISLGIEDKWSSFNFGSNNTWASVKELSPHILQLKQDAYCFHCLGLKRELFQVLLDAPPIGPMDYIHSRLIQTDPKYLCLATWPVIAPQRDCYSYVNGNFENYGNYFLNKGKIV